MTETIATRRCVECCKLSCFLSESEEDIDAHVYSVCIHCSASTWLVLEWVEMDVEELG